MFTRIDPVEEPRKMSADSLDRELRITLNTIESETCIGFRAFTKIKTIHRLALISHHGFASRLGARSVLCSLASSRGLALHIWAWCRHGARIVHTAKPELYRFTMFTTGNIFPKLQFGQVWSISCSVGFSNNLFQDTFATSPCWALKFKRFLSPQS